MKSKKRVGIVLAAIILSLLTFIGNSPLAASPLKDLSALQQYVGVLTDDTFFKPITNVSVRLVSATPSLPEHCVIRARIFPETDVEIKLPTEWNERFWQLGGNGVNGTINSQNYPLSLGYAMAASSGGHVASLRDGSTIYGVKEPYFSEWYPQYGENPYAEQLLIDFGYRSLFETYQLAQKVINFYYGSEPLYSYFSGASNGGKEGLVVAQMYPDLFNGIMVGYPAQSYVSRVWRGYWAQSAEIVRDEKALALYKAVYDRFDSLDGLIDGLLDDPKMIDFDPIIHLPAAEDESDVHSTTAFTLAQREALKMLYGAPVNSKGEILYVASLPSFEYMTDLSRPSTTGIGTSFNGSPSCDLIRHWAFDPPMPPDWDWKTFDWDETINILQSRMLTDAEGGIHSFSKSVEFIDPAGYGYDSITPNMGGLRAFYESGGKLIHYHGWGDSTVPGLISTGFYDATLDELGADATKEFYRLYMVPGMGHGASGVGFVNIPFSLWADALVDWTENGSAPSEIMGTRTGNSTNPYMKPGTRPIPPYPYTVRYQGTGSINDAANFVCVETAEANVKIEPNTLILNGGDPFFVATINLQHQGDWRATSAVYMGALAVDLTRHGNTYAATFNKADLINMTPGERYFTVTLFGERQGNHFGNPDEYPIAYEGTMVINVLAEGETTDPGVISVTPSASVEKINGSKSNLTVVVTEKFSNGENNTIKVTFSIDNNTAGTYKVGKYNVYVDVKGNTQIRECYIINP